MLRVSRGQQLIPQGSQVLDVPVTLAVPHITDLLIVSAQPATPLLYSPAKVTTGDQGCLWLLSIPRATASSSEQNQAV